MERLGADGLVPYAELIGTDCCVASLCDLNLCSMICNFVNLLPSGPLWDQPKKAALLRYQTSCEGGACPAVPEECTTLVAHSIYVMRRTYATLMDVFWPALRESNPDTAYVTMDDWLAKLGWQDCFNSACRDPQLGEITPYEIPGECGPVFCAPEAPELLADSVKHGIILSLIRLQMGVLKNLDGINFVIEPLGARLVPVVDACTVDPDTGETACPIQFSLELTSDSLPPFHKKPCPLTEEYVNLMSEPLQAWYDPNQCFATGLPAKIYPGLLAAECIVRSMLLRDNSIQINRVC